MKVYLVSEWHDESDLVHGAFRTEELAQEYISLHDYGSYMDITECEVLTEIPEHWTLWIASATVYADLEAPLEADEPRSRTIWSQNELPADDPQVETDGRYTNGKPWTLNEIYRLKLSYREMFGPLLGDESPRPADNTWHITARSLDKEAAIRALQEEIERVKATING